MKKLLIFGIGETATIAAEFFIVDSLESLEGFVVDDDYHIPGTLHHGLPVFSLSEAIERKLPENFKIFVALSYGKLNRDRLRVYKLFLKLGYDFASYVSSRALVWRTAEVGKNCMIFEGNNIQHNAVIQDNVILWSGNHIGHGSMVGHSSYISSHVCVAGFSKIGERCFFGVNSTVTDYTRVEDDCFIAAGALVNKDTEKNSIYVGNPAQRNEKITALRYFKVKNDF